MSRRTRAAAGRLAVNRGRQAEGDVARRLTRWAHGLYTFRRLGLGQRGVGDLVVEGGPPAWPFCISVKSPRGPALGQLLHRAGAGAPFAWWLELERRGWLDIERQGGVLTPPDLVANSLAANRASAWLVWRSAPSPRWLLSCWSLGALQTPIRWTLLPNPGGWPRFTMTLDAFLTGVTVEQAIAAIGEGWGQA